MSCSNTAVFSRGDSFSSTWTWTPGEGEPETLIGTTILSTLRDKSSAEYDMTIVIAEDGLSWSATYPGDTSGWALGLASWDFRFAFDGGSISHSTMFRVQIVDTVTQS